MLSPFIARWWSGSCRRNVVSAAILLMLVVVSPGVWGQFPVGRSQPAITNPDTETDKSDSESPVPDSVEVDPVSDDGEIAGRLQGILEATDWFQDPVVRVEEGVVFLTGRTETDVRKKWAGEMVGKTRDVVAVVNQIEVVPPPVWDFSVVAEGIRAPLQTLGQSMPLLIFGAAVLIVAFFLAIFTSRGLMRYLKSRKHFTPLLREVAARAAGVGVFLLGLYLVLLVVGLARLAVTVLGGTGLVGLIIGIAFRDITENFLASIFLSLQRPFRTGDLIEVAEITGLVQRLTVRTTVLLTLDGNHVQVPISFIYKSTIRNFSSNPKRREEFEIAIDYDNVISRAQDVALAVLHRHPAVLQEPSPWVLVDHVDPVAVKLKVYFWLDGSTHHWLKVRSSVIRLVKRAFQEERISMPDLTKELIVVDEQAYGRGITRQLDLDQPSAMKHSSMDSPRQKLDKERDEEGMETARQESDATSTHAEAGLGSDSEALETQARESRMPEPGEDLLRS